MKNSVLQAIVFDKIIKNFITFLLKYDKNEIKEGILKEGNKKKLLQNN